MCVCVCRLPRWLSDQNPPASAGDESLIPGLGRSSGEGDGIPLQYACQGNPMDRGAWWATVHGVTKSRTRLSDFTHSLNTGDAGDVGSIPGSGRSSGGGHGNSLQYSCLGNSMDREAWWATVHGVTKSWT